MPSQRTLKVFAHPVRLDFGAFCFSILPFEKTIDPSIVEWPERERVVRLIEVSSKIVSGPLRNPRDHAGAGTAGRANDKRSGSCHAAPLTLLRERGGLISLRDSTSATNALAGFQELTRHSAMCR